MTVTPTPFRALPAPARALIIGVTVAAVALGATIVRMDAAPTLLGVFALAAGVAGAEGFRLSLPYRSGGLVRFTLVDAAITAALVMASPTELVVGTAIGMLVWQAVDRLPAYKLLYNQAQQVLGVGLASLVMRAVAADHGTLAPQTLAALLLGLVVFLAVNTVAVSGVIALCSEQTLGQSVHRMLPTNAIMTLCNGCLGLLTVAIADQHAWALPALAGPLLLVYSSSRQRVSAQLQRERSHELVDVEHQLSETTEPDRIAAVIVAGVATVLNWRSAVWRNGEWTTAVPEGSGPCPVGADLSRTLCAHGSVLGPAVRASCIAVGLGGGVLVAWSDDRRPDSETQAWLERLARSARVHYERAAASSSLERERATLAAVVDGSSDGIFVLDSAGVVRLTNPAMATLAGVSAATLVGHPLASVLGSGPWEIDGVHDVERPTGTAQYADPRIWRVSVASVRDQTLSHLRIGVVHDVSAERRVGRMKEDMLAVVSHELRTPLTPIKASAQLLSRRWSRLDEAQRTQLLGQIEDRADHLTRLVEDLLLVGQMSSASGSGPTVQPGTVDIGALVQQEVAQLGRTRPDHHLVYDGPASLCGWTDVRRLRQILHNLVENGCKFSPRDSVVTVTLTIDESDAVLCVSDQGRGIPPEDLERVFEQFERVEDPDHMRTSGAGLGLYIVRSLAQAMGGSVSVDSALGAGTTVCLRLPLGQSQPAGARRSIAAV